MNCAECHVPKKDKHSIYTWKNLNQAQCLACHVDQHAGKFSPKFQGGKACTQCHTQENWNIPSFNHSVTGYSLRGKHSTIQCVDCHKQSHSSPSSKLKDFIFKGLRSNCTSCHQESHQFGKFKSARLGDLNDCTKCHEENSWKNIHGFEHNVHTRYPIGGKHIGVACIKCHVLGSSSAGKKQRIYSWPHFPQKTCETCHRSPHRKSFTPELLKKKCTECHTDKGWKVRPGAGMEFDHDKKTRFPLTGKHEKLACEQCHVVNKKEVFKFPGAEKKFCSECHKNVHIRQFDSQFTGQACSECHSTSTFTIRPKFNHDVTAFKLTGKHLPLECTKCHIPTQEQFPVLAGERIPHTKSKFLFASKQKQFCSDCHENEHVGQFHSAFAQQACSNCHTTDDFVTRLPFDHAKTTYPLKGKHMNLECSKCHTSTESLFKTRPGHRKAKYVFQNLRANDCATCHKDPHLGRYGQACSQCHTEEGWRKGAASFHKDFNLTGTHYALDCKECHVNDQRRAGMSQMCITCHQKDDIHHGTLPDCVQCHQQQLWENTDFKHSLTNFPLIGAHRTLECTSCHANNIYKGRASNCASCHQSDALSFTGIPDHTLLMGRNCADCHNEFSWK